MHVRTRCLATILDLLLRAEDDTRDGEDDEDQDARVHEGPRENREPRNSSSSSSKHHARFYLQPAQRWLATVDLLAGPLLRFSEDMDWALPVLRASAAARSAALASARAAEEAENNSITGVSTSGRAGYSNTATTTGGKRSSGNSDSSTSSSSSNQTSSSSGSNHVSYAAANYLQSLQYVALQLLFRRSHWRSYDSWARRCLPPYSDPHHQHTFSSSSPSSPSAVTGNSTSALRSLPRGLALIVEKYTAFTATNVSPAGSSSSSANGSGSGLETLWASLKAQCLRSEDLAHARALTDLLASLSFNLRIASTVGTLSTRLLAQPYAVTDTRSRLIPDGLFLLRGGGGKVGSADVVDTVSRVGVKSGGVDYASAPGTTPTASPRAGGSLWSSGCAAWERGALPNVTSAALELSGSGVSVPLTLESLTKPALYISSNSSRSSGESHGQVSPAAAAALTALARLCGLPYDKSYMITAGTINNHHTTISSSHSDRSAFLVSLLAFEWAATPLAPIVLSTVDRRAQDDCSSTLSRAGAAARLVERLRHLALKLESFNRQDKTSTSKSPRSKSSSSNSNIVNINKRHEASALAAPIQFEWLTDDLQPTLVAATFAVVLATLATAEPSLSCVELESPSDRGLHPRAAAAASVGTNRALHSPLSPASPSSSSLATSRPLSFGPYQPLGDACAAAGWLLASCREALTVPSSLEQPTTVGATAAIFEASKKAGRSRKQSKLSPPSPPRSPSAAVSAATAVASNTTSPSKRKQQQGPITANHMLSTTARALEACAIKFLRGLGPCLEERLSQLVHWRATHLDAQTNDTTHSGGARYNGNKAASTLEQAARIEFVQKVCESVASLLATARGLAHFLAQQAQAKMAKPDFDHIDRHNTSHSNGHANGKNGHHNDSRRRRRKEHHNRRQTTMPIAARSLPRLLLALARADAALARVVEVFRLEPLSTTIQGPPNSLLNRRSGSRGGGGGGGTAAAAGSKRVRSRDQKRESRSKQPLGGKQSRRVGGSSGHNRISGGSGGRSSSDEDGDDNDDDDDDSSGSDSSGSDSAYEDDDGVSGNTRGINATKENESAADASGSWRCLVPNFLPARQGSSGEVAEMGDGRGRSAAVAASEFSLSTPTVTANEARRRDFTTAQGKGNNWLNHESDDTGQLSAPDPAGGSAEESNLRKRASGTLVEQPTPFRFDWSGSDESDGNGNDSDGSSGSDTDFVVLGSGGAWG